MLDHRVGRFSEASLCAIGPVAPNRAEVEVFGPGGSATIDCTGVAEPDSYLTMLTEFADAVERGSPPELDVRHGLRLQRVIEAAETDLIVGT